MKTSDRSMPLWAAALALLALAMLISPAVRATGSDARSEIDAANERLRTALRRGDSR